MEQENEQIAGLRSEIEALRKLLETCIETIALHNQQLKEQQQKWEYGFTPGDSSFLTEEDKIEIRKDSSFWMFSTKFSTLKSEDGTNAIARFSQFSGDKEERANSTYGVYQLPATGRYRFRVKGAYSGRGKIEWFICCDGENEKERRPLEFSVEDEYQTINSERRMSLFTLEEPQDSKTAIVILFSKRHVKVWVECRQLVDDLEIDLEEGDQLACTFQGAFLD